MAFTPSPPQAPQPKSLAGSAFSSLWFLVALQLFSRLFTSALNQALFRLASPSVFGTAAIQFELILSTILFLSREGVRNAVLRSGGGRECVKVKDKGEDKDGEEEEDGERAMNLTFLPFYLGVPLAVVTAAGYVASASEEVRQQPHLVLAVVVYALAALVELLSEPMHNMAMVQMKTEVRVRAEGLGITCKSIVTLLLLVYDVRYGQDRLQLVAFAVGQLAYSVVVFSCYAAKLGVPWLKRASTGVSRFSFESRLLRLSLTMTGQSVIKHFLTEGDKLVLSFSSPLQDQGGYAIALNYGSLVARIVFQPIEETLRVFFSKLLSPPSQSDSESKANRKAALTQSANALTGLISIQLAFSVVVVIFGSAYLPILLPVLLPQRYLETSAPKILAAWIYYIPVLALNGGLEAFLSSAAGPRDLNRQSRWMVVFSAVYVLVTIWFYRLGFGDVSLIYANIVNLVARIVYCLSFVFHFFGDVGVKADSVPVSLDWRSAVPSLPFLAVSGFSAYLVRVSYSRLGVENIIRSGGRSALFVLRILAHIGIGGVLALGCLGVWWITQGRRVIAKSRHNKVD